jgi:hypothetical protein
LLNYQKVIYVRVFADDVSYTISDNLLLLTEGGSDTISVTISGISNFNYATDISWQVDDPSIVSIVPAGSGNECALYAQKIGTAIISATYGSIIRRCTVVVSQKKSISIAATADICPNQVLQIPFIVAPAGSTVTYKTDTANCITVNSLDSATGILTITGKATEGYTVITLTANGITAQCTVYTNYNYYFQPSVAAVRGAPQGTYTVNYTINPARSEVICTNYNDTVLGISIDSENQRITITPKKAGYSNVRLFCASNSCTINLPCYFYYANIPFAYTSSVANYNVSNNARHTVIDEVQAAIHLGDGEQITIIPNISNVMYPNNGLTIKSATFTSAGNSAIRNTIAATQSTAGVGSATLYASTYGSIGNASETLYSTGYAGIFKITYQYFKGGTTMQEESIQFLVYGEHWLRR